MMSPVAVALAASFNLVCLGSTEKITAGYGGRDNSPFDTTLRIDLARRLWCEGDCQTRLPIADVSAKVITLYEQDDYTSRLNHIVVSKIVNRVTGEYFATDESTSAMDELLSARNVRAKCEVKPFSGFPRPAPPPKVKF